MAEICPDWVITEQSNVNICVNREWFNSYTPCITSLPADEHGDETIPVLGIGTVLIQVESANGSSNLLTLWEVLHTPTMAVNIIGQPFLDEEIAYISHSDMTLRKESGPVIGLLEHRAFPPLVCLKIVMTPGTNWAESKLIPGLPFHIRAHWSNEERTKFVENCRAIASANFTT